METHIVAGWIQNLSPTKRHCTLLGWNCVATFDICPETIAPLAGKIQDALRRPALMLAMKQCDDIDIGLYGPNDVRAWPVTKGI